MNDAFLGLNQALFVIGGKDAGKTHTFVGNVADPGKKKANKHLIIPSLSNLESIP